MTVNSSTRRNTSHSRPARRFRIGNDVIRLDPGDPHGLFAAKSENPENYTEEIPERELPGFAEETQQDDCGDAIPHACADCGKVEEVARTCYSWRCPRCAPAAAYRRTKAAAAKLESYRRHENKETPGDSLKFHHVVLSPSDTFCSAGENTQDLFYEVAKEILSSLGAVGGILVQHDYRGAGEDDDDRGKWKDRLFAGRKFEDVREGLNHEPHLHAVVLADYIDGTACKAIYDQSRIVTHRITKDNSNVSIYGKKDLTSAISYALSHAAVNDDGNAEYRYFGSVANHAADPDVQADINSVTQSVVRQTLDLHTADLHCNEESQDGTAHTPPSQTGSQPSESGSDTDTTSTGGDTQNTTTSGADSVTQTHKCGGRLIPIYKAAHLLESSRDLEHEQELRDAIQNWDSPPD